MRATFSVLPPLDALAERWRALEARTHPSFFLSWHWIGAWLEATGARPELLVVTDGAGDRALALVGHAYKPRLLGRAATLLLNESGDPAADRAFIEYNGLLAEDETATRAAMQALGQRRDWRVLRLAGVEPGSPLIAGIPARRRTRIDASPAWYIDLAAVRDAQGDYLSLLSTNTRTQIRRSARDYPAEPTVVAATSPDEAETWLAEMRTLNAGRHADNAWEEAVFRGFAGTLVGQGLKTGAVELLRIAAGDALLGYLLNFVHGDRAMNYQSAFAPGLTPKSKPGLMCHAAAVSRYADAPSTGSGRALSFYSLLAGKDRYKQSLATGSEMLEWWQLERFSPRLEAEHLLRSIMKRPASG